MRLSRDPDLRRTAVENLGHFGLEHYSEVDEVAREGLAPRRGSEVAQLEVVEREADAIEQRADEEGGRPGTIDRQPQAAHRLAAGKPAFLDQALPRDDGARHAACGRLVDAAGYDPHRGSASDQIDEGGVHDRADDIDLPLRERGQRTRRAPDADELDVDALGGEEPEIGGDEQGSGREVGCRRQLDAVGWARCVAPALRRRRSNRWRRAPAGAPSS